MASGGCGRFQLKALRQLARLCYSHALSETDVSLLIFFFFFFFLFLKRTPDFVCPRPGWFVVTANQAV
jgi:hypothetical protein